jgi:hypothetical protein
MDLITLMGKLRDLAAAMKNGDWLAAGKIAFEVAAVLLPLLTQPRPMMAKTYASKSDDELAAEIERQCNLHMATISSAATPIGGPFINAIWPLVVEALLRILANLK